MTRELPGLNVQRLTQGEGMRLLPADFNERHGGTVPGPLPDPTVTGPCQVQATFMCTGQAAGERLIPTSMLPDSLIKGPLYAPMCLPCYEHLADAYIAETHRGVKP